MAFADKVHAENGRVKEGDWMTDEQLFTACQILLSVFMPPLAVFLERGVGVDFMINFLLTLLVYLPGMLHALYIVLKNESTFTRLAEAEPKNQFEDADSSDPEKSLLATHQPTKKRSRKPSSTKVVPNNPPGRGKGQPTAGDPDAQEEMEMGRRARTDETAWLARAKAGGRI